MDVVPSNRHVCLPNFEHTAPSPFGERSSTWCCSHHANWFQCYIWDTKYSSTRISQFHHAQPVVPASSILTTRLLRLKLVSVFSAPESALSTKTTLELFCSNTQASRFVVATVAVVVALLRVVCCRRCTCCCTLCAAVVDAVAVFFSCSSLVLLLFFSCCCCACCSCLCCCLVLFVVLLVLLVLALVVALVLLVLLMLFMLLLLL